jgi:hypothetical protein
MRVLTTTEVKVTHMTYKQLYDGRDYYMKVEIKGDIAANRLTMLNIFSSNCYGSLQAIATKYYNEQGEVGKVKDRKRTGAWDRMDFELLWQLLFKQFPGPANDAVNKNSTMLSRLLKALPKISTNSEEVTKLGQVFNQACTDLGWEDSIEDDGPPEYWLPNPMNAGVISGFLRDIGGTREGKELYRHKVMTGEGIDSSGPCTTISVMIARFEHMAESLTNMKSQVSIVEGEESHRQTSNQNNHNKPFVQSHWDDKKRINLFRVKEEIIIGRWRNPTRQFYVPLVGDKDMYRIFVFYRNIQIPIKSSRPGRRVRKEKPGRRRVRILFRRTRPWTAQPVLRIGPNYQVN